MITNGTGHSRGRRSVASMSPVAVVCCWWVPFAIVPTRAWRWVTTATTSTSVTTAIATTTAGAVVVISPVPSWRSSVAIAPWTSTTVPAAITPISSRRAIRVSVISVVPSSAVSPVPPATARRSHHITPHDVLLWHSFLTFCCFPVNRVRRDCQDLVYHIFCLKSHEPEPSRTLCCTVDHNDSFGHVTKLSKMAFKAVVRGFRGKPPNENLLGSGSSIIRGSAHWGAGLPWDCNFAINFSAFNLQTSRQGCLC
mmetsp:Transcript_50219/g.98447  ORF Transcript_50219/g.98447 Transcript_50219/m.98447 type:complete len:253 (-) Transcript_50219:229-987(-)